MAPGWLPVGAEPLLGLGSAAHKNSQLAVSVSLVFSSPRGLRSCLSRLARFIGGFPVLLGNNTSMSGNDVPAELAPLPLLALLLFLPGFSSRRAALRLVLEAKRGCSFDLFLWLRSRRRGFARSRVALLARLLLVPCCPSAGA